MDRAVESGPDRDGAGALAAGDAFADLSSWRKVRVVGSDARGWLNDLLTADIADLLPGFASRSLLLSPTGRIRADVTIAALTPGFLLVQDPSQPVDISRLLAPYVLSSDVQLQDQTDSLCLLAFPGREPPEVDGAESYRPSALGTGADLVAPSGARDVIRRAAAPFIEADVGAVRTWWIRAGVARFPVDLGEDSLPHEAALDPFIGYEKGCFLGQEAVAKVRNLGHPPFLLLAAHTARPVEAGEPVQDEAGREVGSVTSATPIPEGGAAVIARIRWGARQGPLTTPSGGALVRRRPASGVA
jgi:folate-binding protein YgfZ